MYEEIKNLPIINRTDNNKVNELAESMLKDGWKDSPILYTNLGLVTGSHRLVALNKLNEMLEDAEDDMYNTISEILENVETIDVTDIINDYCEKNDCGFDNIDFSSLGKIFEGTEIEQYKDEIEW